MTFRFENDSLIHAPNKTIRISQMEVKKKLHTYFLLNCYILNKKEMVRKNTR